MSFVAVAVGVGSLVVGAYAANKQAGAAKKAGQLSNDATNRSIDEQQREYNQNREDQLPWLNTGKSALSMLGGMYGLNPDGSGVSGQAPDYSAFYQSPDYQFALQQGQQALDRSAAARGSLFSGGQNADTLKFGQGLASQQFGNFYNRLAGLAGIGQSSAQNLGAAGMGMANSIGNLNMQNAQNQMGSVYDKANAWSNFGNQLAGFGGQMAGRFGGGAAAPMYTSGFAGIGQQATTPMAMNVPNVAMNMQPIQAGNLG